MEIIYEVEKTLAKELIDDPHIYKKLLLIQGQSKEIREIINSLTECEHVFESLTFIQAKTCSKGRKWVKIIEMYFLLILFVSLIGISFRRFGLYLQKKLDEEKVIKRKIEILKINFIYNL